MTRGIVATALALILSAAGIETATWAATGEKAPATSSTPTAGICSGEKGRIATVDLTPDVPSPRCLVVRCPQRIAVRNDTAKVARVKLQTFRARRVRPGATTLFDRPVRTFLAAGVHSLRVSTYAGGGPSIDVKCGRAPAPAPTFAG